MFQVSQGLPSAVSSTRITKDIFLIPIRRTDCHLGILVTRVTAICPPIPSPPVSLSQTYIMYGYQHAQHSLDTQESPGHIRIPYISTSLPWTLLTSGWAMPTFH
jgi:hypothetical protein